MRILHVTVEVNPWAKVGGLADVLAALPAALAQDAGHEVQLVLPRYPWMPKGSACRTLQITGVAGQTCVEITQAWLPTQPQLQVYLVDHPWFTQRSGIYGDKQQPNYEDNYLRFALLSQAAAHIAGAWDGCGPADVLHAHDWSTALALYYAREAPLKRIFTLHNGAFWGLTDINQGLALAINPDDLAGGHLQYNDQLCLLKAGLLYAHQITTVSPTYAQELLQTPNWLGETLRSRVKDFTGIINGIDQQVWDPSKDPWLGNPYGPIDQMAWPDIIAARAQGKAKLQQAHGLPVVKRVPLCGIIARLAAQKGWDLLLEWFESGKPFSHDAQYIILTSGDGYYAQRLIALQQLYPDQFALELRYDEGLAHQITAGSDIFLMPSSFEPCGLNQLYSMHYGCVPIVRAVGGLLDTVVPYEPHTKRSTGFICHEATLTAWHACWELAVHIYLNDTPTWRGLMQRGMGQDFSWRKSAEHYNKIYESAKI